MVEEVNVEVRERFYLVTSGEPLAAISLPMASAAAFVIPYPYPVSAHPSLMAIVGSFTLHSLSRCYIDG